MSLEAQLRPRPLSPHLAIYRRTMTMMMSIVHRLTGTALYFGMLLLTWWLIAAVEGAALIISVVALWPAQAFEL